LKCEKISSKFDKKHTLENGIGKFFQIATLVLVISSPWKIASAIWNCFKVGFLIGCFLKGKSWILHFFQGDKKNRKNAKSLQELK
jgi:hypothetical protein